MLRKNKLLIYLLLLLFISPAFFGLLHKGFFVSDDGNSMVIRFSAFYEALRNGQFPVRFLPRLNNQYGYPVADFLYPLFMYIGVPIHLLKFSFVTTVKILFGSSLLLSAIFSFQWLQKRFSVWSAFVGATVYTLFPYHLFDIYKRGSLGEVLVLAIVPFILLQIENDNFLFVSLGISLLITAHNTLALLFLPVIVCYMLLKPVAYIKIIYTTCLSLGLSAFFWIPALYDKKFTIFDRTTVSDYATYFVSFSENYILWIGILIIVLISVYTVSKKQNAYAIFFLIVTFICIFFATLISLPFWRLLPLGVFVQFPFRFLSVVIISVSFLIAFLIDKTASNLKWINIIIILCIVYISAAGFIFPKRYQEYPDGYYSTNQGTTTVQNEYIPKWVKSTPLNAAKEKVALIQGKGKIGDVTGNGNTLHFNTNLQTSSIVQINTIYFPGWKIFSDGREQEILYNNMHGLMQVVLPTGQHTIVAKFGETPVRMLADMISVLSILTLSILGFLQIFAKKKKHL